MNINIAICLTERFKYEDIYKVYMAYKKFNLKRVPYGKADTPLELREYTVKEFPTSAVGTINEIADFVRDSLPQKKVILRTNDSGEFKFNFEVKA